MKCRVEAGVEFTDVLSSPLPFKIPIMDFSTVLQWSRIFQYGKTEYGVSVDSWLQHSMLSLTSEQAVVIADGAWQNVLKSVALLSVMLDEHDKSSMTRMRPDFTATYKGILVMKGEAKSSLTDMMESYSDLISKFHSTAHKIFPKGCTSLPAVMTCNEQIHLYAISYGRGTYSLTSVKVYNVAEIRGRIEFIVDIFKLVVWIMSQTEPIERFHLVPDVRRRTRNGHHVTLLSRGIYKEFDHSKLSEINLEAIRTVYDLKLNNVETGTVNGRSVTITRVGSKLIDAMRARCMDLEQVYNEICLGVRQLHDHNYAHCDICVDNIFVDSVEDGGHVFLGDLEYCRLKIDHPPANIRRGDNKARTAEELDNFQLEKIKDEIASML